MRLTLSRVVVALVTFTVGLCAVLMWRGVINVNHLRQITAKFTRRAALEPTPEHRVIYDVRDYVEGDMSYEELKAAGEQELAWTERVAPDVFPGRGLRHWGLCDEQNWERRARNEADLEWALNRGQFVPWVRERHTGNFTAPHAQETLYEIEAGECNTRSGFIPESRRFAIYGDDKLRAAVKASGEEKIYKVVPDTDGDGVDELLLARGVEHVQWSFPVQLQLITLKGGTRRLLHDFGVAYVYGHADFLQEIIITIPLIYCVPGSATHAPEYHAHFFRASCRRDAGCKDFPPPGTWRYYKSGRLKLPDYVELWPQAIESWWWHEVILNGR